jgi:hypothetical protein
MPCGCQKNKTNTPQANKVVSAKPNPSRPLNESGRSRRADRRIIR